MFQKLYDVNYSLSNLIQLYRRFAVLRKSNLSVATNQTYCYFSY